MATERPRAPGPPRPGLLRAGVRPSTRPRSTGLRSWSCATRCAPRTSSGRLPALVAAPRGLRPRPRRPGRVPAAHGALAGRGPVARGRGPRPRAPPGRGRARGPARDAARATAGPPAAAADPPRRRRPALGRARAAARRAARAATRAAPGGRASPTVGGLTAEEIAVRDGIPLGTVKSRVRLGLDKLRDVAPPRRAAREPRAERPGRLAGPARSRPRPCRPRRASSPKASTGPSAPAPRSAPAGDLLRAPGQHPAVKS